MVRKCDVTVNVVDGFRGRLHVVVEFENLNDRRALLKSLRRNKYEDVVGTLILGKEEEEEVINLIDYEAIISPCIKPEEVE